MNDEKVVRRPWKSAYKARLSTAIALRKAESTVSLVRVRGSTLSDKLDKKPDRFSKGNLKSSRVTVR